MKIEHLEIRNFRAIERVYIESDSAMVVIAGPNGCGKSCVLDAIRLAKSAYGGYAANEYRSWLGEFQIDPNSPADMRKVLRKKDRDALIRIGLSLHTNEVDYLNRKANEIGERSAISTIMPSVSFEEWRQRIQASGQQSQAEIIQLIEKFGEQLSKTLREQLASTVHEGTVSIKPEGTVSLSPNIVLQSAWSIYEPQSIGIVDYHGPQRHFSRENLGGVNLSLKTQEEGQKKSVLYNCRPSAEFGQIGSMI